MNIVDALIAVIGGRSERQELLSHAEEVGSKIAERGAVLLCGGLTGIMEAAAQGAKKSKEITIGLLPGETKEEANQYIDIPIATGLGLARNATGRRALGVVTDGPGIIEVPHTLPVRQEGLAFGLNFCESSYGATCLLPRPVYRDCYDDSTMS